MSNLRSRAPGCTEGENRGYLLTCLHSLTGGIHECGSSSMEGEIKQDHLDSELLELNMLDQQPGTQNRCEITYYSPNGVIVIINISIHK